MVSTSIIFIVQSHNLYFFFSLIYNKKNNKYQKRIIDLKKTTKSLLEELNSIHNQRYNEQIVESRATHVINSAINLLNLIKETYSPDQAYELERRLINSIKGNDPNKFIRGIRKVRDTKEVGQSLKVIDGDIKED